MYGVETWKIAAGPALMPAGRRWKRPVNLLQRAHGITHLADFHAKVWCAPTYLFRPDAIAIAIFVEKI